MNRKLFHLFVVTTALLSSAFAQELQQELEIESQPTPQEIQQPEDDRFQIQTSIQAGTEYDSNVYKTFANQNGDLLTRLLFKNQGDYLLTPNVNLGWDYQGGGKKFFNDDAQDQIIQNISIPLQWNILPKLRMLLDTDFKYQNERDKLDDDLDDINEDFLSSKTDIRFLIGLPKGFNIQPYGSFTYFHFFPNQTFSFYREEGGLTAERRTKNLAYGLEYSYYKQQFEQSFRQDSIHEISPYIQYLKKPFASLSYSYQVNHSNDPAFSFNNHKINFLTSFLFGKIKNKKENQPEARFSTHLIATLQLKNYSSVFSEAADGTRFLVTGSEDENFNNLVFKFNYHFHKKWALETKYTRISNELTSQQTRFTRSIYYSGLRYDF